MEEFKDNFRIDIISCTDEELVFDMVRLQMFPEELLLTGIVRLVLTRRLLMPCAVS
jgi:hypothetical protein